jgi:hypothetical protein
MLIILHICEKIECFKNIPIFINEHIKSNNMSTPAHDQLEFQKYNQNLGGPDSPVPMAKLTKAAEQEKEATDDYFGFGSECGDWPEKDLKEDNRVYFFPNTVGQMATEPMEAPATMMIHEPTVVPIEPAVATVAPEPTVVPIEPAVATVAPEPTVATVAPEPIEPTVAPEPTVATPSPSKKRKSKDTNYEVRSGNTVLTSFDTADEAMRYIESQEVSAIVIKCERSVWKPRKRVATSPRKRVATSPRKSMKSLRNMGEIDFGAYQPLDGSLDAKGKQTTWWVKSSLKMDSSTTSAEIRAAALLIRKVPASEIVNWVEKDFNISDELRVWPMFIDDDNNLDSIRRTTFRIRSVIKRLNRSPDARIVSLASV